MPVANIVLAPMVFAPLWNTAQKYRPTSDALKPLFFLGVGVWIVEFASHLTTDAFVQGFTAVFRSIFFEYAINRMVLERLATFFEVAGLIWDVSTIALNLLLIQFIRYVTRALQLAQSNVF